ncbi:MAG: type II secretion system F family protein [Actinomycetota bacterium]
MSEVLRGALVGAAAGSGVFVAVTNSPVLRRTSLDSRLAPYLRDAPRPSRLLHLEQSATPFPTLERILKPVLGDLSLALERWLGGSASIKRRLLQAGRDMTIEEFRAEQVIWGAIGLLAGIGAALLSVATRSGPGPLPMLMLCLVLAVIGVLARDRRLTTRVAEREKAMLAEFPTIAELLALAVTAGEGAVGAIERVCRTSRGELARELRKALDEARSGSSLIVSLEGIAARTSLPALARFVDGMSIAVERGTPLADVLRAQAVDVREEGKRLLLESAGKREIGMLIPVVFFVLPLTIVFALFPGFIGLQLVS